jgi:hypothetical protein
MGHAFSESLEVAWTRERDHSDPSVQFRDLPVEVPQLREMLLAVESTEVAEENQNGWAPKQSAGGEDFGVNRHEVEVQIDQHRIMMRPPPRRYVTDITASFVIRC